MIQNEAKEGWHYLAVKENYVHYKEEQHQNINNI